MRLSIKAPLAVALLALATAGPVAMSAEAKAATQCFRAQDWRGSSAGGPREAYIRVGTKEVYRLNFAQDCAGARYPGPVQINNLVSGSNSICSPADLDITIGPRGSSFYTACIVSDITKLTSAEVASLPNKVIP
jgi:hypothetical protein